MRLEWNPSWRSSCELRDLAMPSQHVESTFFSFKSTIPSHFFLLSFPPNSDVTAGKGGLSISYALSITQTLNWMVRMTSEVETNIVGKQRWGEREEEANKGQGERNNDFWAPEPSVIHTSRKSTPFDFVRSPRSSLRPSFYHLQPWNASRNTVRSLPKPLH